MENQINVGDQSTQQIGKKPDSRPPNIQNNPRINYWMISTLIFAFILVAFTGRYIHITDFLEQGGKGAFPTVTEAPPTTVSPDKIKIYENPTLRYTFRYPSDWEGGGITRPTMRPTREEYFQITSPDYKILDTADGIFYIDKGSQILVDTESTLETSVDNLLNKDIRRKELARNIINVVVDGQQGLQYEYTDQKILGTTTMFIKNGVAYSITFNYANQDERKNRWSIYQNLINSFKA